MTMLFYLREASEGPAIVECPPSIDIRLWCPGRDGFPKADAFRSRNAFWWAANRAGLLANADFTEITLLDGRWLLHRLILTPRWYRFPFMARDDLQIGDVWTEPWARGQGLARLAITRALEQAGRRRRVWYVTAADNRASIRLIESCRFTLMGAGRRSFGPAGRFHLKTAR